MARSSLGRVSTASSSSTSRSARPRTTWWALVRRLAATKRVGHGGTLDPFAAGVLPVFLGRATRIVEYHLGDGKAYRATICFGESSTTDDLEGERTPATGAAPSREAVEAALPSFTGPLEQRPPAYSAIKVGGRRAYAMARAGETVELAARDVTIHELSIVEWDDTDPDRPIAVVDVTCSAGTYVRALARDLGASLGSAAYLGALRRTAAGPFRLEDAPVARYGARCRCGGTGRPHPAAAPGRRGSRALPGRGADGLGTGRRREGAVHPTRSGLHHRRGSISTACPVRRAGGHRDGSGRRRTGPRPGQGAHLGGGGRLTGRRGGRARVAT